MTNTEFSSTTERYRTMQNDTELGKTMQNSIERTKTFYRFCLVLVRTMRTFCEVLGVLLLVLVVLIELPFPFWNVLKLFVVLQFFLAMYTSFPKRSIEPGRGISAVYRQDDGDVVDTVSSEGAPFYLYGKFVGYVRN